MEIGKPAAGLLLLFVLIFFATFSSFGSLRPAELLASVIGSDSGRILDRVAKKDSRRESVVFLGDIMLARDVERRLARMDTTHPLLMLQNTLNAKVVVGNFEAAIPEVHKPTPDFGMSFSVIPANLEVLVKGGLTHLSLANNHTYDHGVSAYQHTVAQLELYGFKALGHPRIVSTSSIAYFDVDDQKVALIAINATYGYPSPSAWQPVIEKAVKSSDLQIVYIHWGEEYVLTHNIAQENFAKALAEAGIDLIVGHHPHVVQDIARYGDTLVFYSLGNFIFDQYFSDEVQEGLSIELKRSQNQWSIVLNPVESKSIRVQPRLMEGDARAAFLNSLANRSDVELFEEITAGEVSLQF